jgi:hypothetical protein
MEHGKVAKCCMTLVAMDAQEATLEQEQEKYLGMYGIAWIDVFSWNTNTHGWPARSE